MNQAKHDADQKCLVEHRNRMLETALSASQNVDFSITRRFGYEESEAAKVAVFNMCREAGLSLADAMADACEMADRVFTRRHYPHLVREDLRWAYPY